MTTGLNGGGEEDGGSTIKTNILNTVCLLLTRKSEGSGF